MSVIAKNTSFKHYGLIAPIQSRWLPWISWVWTLATNAHTVQGKQVWNTRSSAAYEVRTIARLTTRFSIAMLFNMQSLVSEHGVELRPFSVQAPGLAPNFSRAKWRHWGYSGATTCARPSFEHQFVLPRWQVPLGIWWIDLAFAVAVWPQNAGFWTACSQVLGCI